MRRFCSLALFAGAALAQIPAVTQPPLPAGVYRPGAGVQAPIVVSKSDPDYTQEARLARLEGSVLLSLIVGKDAKPREIRVERPLGLGLDENAAAKVREWIFRPGTKDGMPADVLINVELFFRRPRGLWEWHLARAAFDPPAGASRPVVIETRYPAASDTEQNVLVQVSFDVDIQGMARNTRVEKSSDPKWDAEIIAALSDGWRFQPGFEDGNPVAVRGRFAFVRGSHSPIPLR
jgi:TonB family protein